MYWRRCTIAVWAAHARVLLPWIEVRRQGLAQILEERFGVVTAGMTGPVELGPLHLLVRDRLPRTRSALREVSAQLMRTRNKLAHLQSLSLADQVRLVAACAVLDAG